MIDFAVELTLHFFASLGRLFISAAITVLFSLPLGWVAFKSKIFYNITNFLSSIPAMALLPIIMLLFGIGEISKQMLLLASGIWVCTIRLSEVYKGLNVLLEPFVVNNYSIRKAVLKIVIPTIRCDIAEAFRRTFLVSITLLLIAENYGTEYGVGYYINHAWQSFDYLGVAHGIILAAVMGLFCNIIIEKHRPNGRCFLLYIFVYKLCK